MNKAKIAVLVSGGGTNLQALIDAQGRGEIPHGEISLVISNKEGLTLWSVLPMQAFLPL